MGRAFSIRAAATVLALLPTCLTTPLRAEDADFTSPPVTLDGGPRTFQTEGGVRVEVRSGPEPTTDRQALEAMEQAAAQLRARLAPPTTAELAAVPDNPAPPADDLCPDGGCLLDLQCLGLGCYEATVLPQTLLWEIPIANNHEPRMFIKPTDLNTATTAKNFDAAIGGEGGILRLGPLADPDLLFQLDLFAVVFTRYASYNTLTGVDYRAGVPLTFSCGPWEGKVGYEHTSTHLGDDYIRNTGQRKNGRIRDEVVAGLAYRFNDDLRAYGQIGYAGITFTTPGPKRPDRYDMGLEWNRRRPTGCCGAPYAAVDLQFFGDENYTPDVAAQVGWQWVGPDPRASVFRVGLDAFDGRSPFGQFFTEKDRWVGAVISYDF